MILKLFWECNSICHYGFDQRANYCLSDVAFFLFNFQKFLPQILYFQIPYNTLCLTPNPPAPKFA